MKIQPGETVEFYLGNIFLGGELVLQTYSPNETFQTVSGVYKQSDLQSRRSKLFQAVNPYISQPLIQTIDLATAQKVEVSAKTEPTQNTKSWQITRHHLDLGQVTLYNQEDLVITEQTDVFCEFIVCEFIEPMINSLNNQISYGCGEISIEVNLFPLFFPEDTTLAYLQQAARLVLITQDKQKKIVAEHLRLVSVEDTTGSGKYKTVKFLAEGYSRYG